MTDTPKEDSSSASVKTIQTSTAIQDSNTVGCTQTHWKRAFWVVFAILIILFLLPSLCLSVKFYAILIQTLF